MQGVLVYTCSPVITFILAIHTHAHTLPCADKTYAQALPLWTRDTEGGTRADHSFGSMYKMLAQATLPLSPLVHLKQWDNENERESERVSEGERDSVCLFQLRE